MSWMHRRWTLCLAAFCTLVYLPFLGFRVVRTAGDEKVYINQAVEMIDRGLWFLQRLWGKPDYFKGPLHYIAVHFGQKIFGLSMWSTLYMNVALIFIAAGMLGRLFKSALPDFTAGPLFGSIALVSSATVYAHVFASQMEIELVSFYAIAMVALWRTTKEGASSLSFWFFAGLTGWIKSPLFSVLLGVSAILFWMTERDLKSRLSKLVEWRNVLVGITVCALGYLTPAIFEFPEFYRTYVLRETFLRPGAGEAPIMLVVPLLTYFIFPWSIPAAAILPMAIRGAWIKKGNSHALIRLAFAIALPTILFFSSYHFRYSNYSLPALSAVILLVGVLMGSLESQSRMAKFFARGGQLVLALVALAFTGGLIWLAQRFTVRPDWLPAWVFPLAAICAGLTAFFWFWNAIRTPLDWGRMALSSAGLWIGVSILLATFGEREMVDLRSALRDHPTQSPLIYYNWEPSVWCEGGYLNFMIHRRVDTVLKVEDLEAPLRNGQIVLIAENPTNVWSRKVVDYAHKLGLKGRLVVRPWTRWKTRARSETGESLLWPAIRDARFDLVENQATMIWIEQP